MFSCGQLELDSDLWETLSFPTVVISYGEHLHDSMNFLYSLCTKTIINTGNKLRLWIYANFLTKMQSLNDNLGRLENSIERNYKNKVKKKTWARKSFFPPSPRYLLVFSTYYSFFIVFGLGIWSGNIFFWEKD